MKREIVLAAVAALGIIVALGFKAQIAQRARTDALAEQVAALRNRIERLEAMWAADDVEAARPPALRDAQALRAPAHVAALPSPRSASAQPAADGDTKTTKKAGNAGAAATAGAVATDELNAADDASDADAQAVLAEFHALASHGLGALGRLADGKLVARFRALGDTGLELLTTLLRDAETSESRVLAAAILEKLGDRHAIPALDQALNDEDVLVRRMASHALATLDDDGAIAALERAMYDDRDWGVRANAAYGLARLGRQQGIDALRRFYEDASIDPASKLAVLGGMAEVGEIGYADIFRPLLTDEHAELTYRLLALHWAARARDAQTRDAIEQMVRDPRTPPSLREAARRALAVIEKGNDER